MVKKPRRMRTFARTATKSMEKQIIETAKQIKKDPYIILPDYQDSFSEKIFTKLKKQIDKVQQNKEDTKKLEKLSKKKDLRGAIAGTILISHQEKAPYLAVGKFPTGEVTYAQRGQADKEKLIAIQHFDDPILRLLAIKDVALKKNMYIYSWDEGYISTGDTPNPPDEFIKFLIKKTNLKNKDQTAYCGDIKPEEIQNKKPVKDYLWIYWKSAKTYISICKDCAKSKKKNTLFNLTKYMLHPDISNDFEIEVISKAIKGKTIELNQETSYIDEYLSGKLNDYDFIQKNIKQQQENLRESGEKVYILDGVSYGIDLDEFIKKLKPNKYEKQGLEIILEEIDEPVVFNSTTPNKVIEKYWKNHGLDTVKQIISDEEMAQKFYQLNDSPSEILELASNYAQRQKILAKLPRYSNLPMLADFADNVAKTYKTFGEKNAIVEIKKHPDNTKAKSIAYAFLLVFKKGEDKKWKYSKVEIEYGEFLKEYAEKLLNSDPENYHDALQELLTVSGSSEKID